MKYLLLCSSWGRDVPAAVQDGRQGHLVSKEQEEDGGSGGEASSPGSGQVRGGVRRKGRIPEEGERTPEEEEGSGGRGGERRADRSRKCR